MTFGIESANVVGYNTDSVQRGKFLIKAAQFNDVASGDIAVDKVYSGFTGVDFDEDLNFQITAPQILVQDSEGNYVSYYFLNDAYIEADGSTCKGWADSNGNYAGLTMTPGLSFWVKDPMTDVTTTTSGAVSDDDSVTVEIAANQYTLVGNAFPIAVTLNGSQMTSPDIKGVDFDEDLNFQSSAPQILVQDSDGNYVSYYYLNDAYVEADDSTTKGWSDSNGNYITDTIAVGKGFWIKSISGAMTLVFKK